MDIVSSIFQKKVIKKWGYALLICSFVAAGYTSQAAAKGTPRVSVRHHHSRHHTSGTHAQVRIPGETIALATLPAADNTVTTFSTAHHLAAVNLTELAQHEATLNIHGQSTAAVPAPVITATLPSAAHAGTPAQNHLVRYVDETIYNLRYSRYHLGSNRFDPTRGVYVVDCSRFVDHVLSDTYPNAYLNLVNASGSPQPATQHFYDFFHELANDTDSSPYWKPIEQINELRPGDILVFRSKHNRVNHANGHVVVVMDQPVRTAEAFAVRVADSAIARHSADTRQPHESGIGIGTLLLKPNPDTGKPTAYAWQWGGTWRHNVYFAMARPLKLSV